MEKQKCGIIEDRAVQRWLNLSSSSKGTERVYLFRIRKFCDTFGISTKQIMKEWEEVKHDLELRERFLEKYRDPMLEYTAILKKKGYQKNFILNCLGTVRSFFEWNRIPLGKMKIPKDLKRSSLGKFHNRDITKEELRSILQHSTLRDRAIYLFMKDSGLRPLTIVRLRYKHIKQDYEANRVPMLAKSPAEIVKGGYYDDRFTFIGEEAFKDFFLNHE